MPNDELSIGDYVLTGGELAAMVVVDAVSRLIPGVLTNESTKTLSLGLKSYASESDVFWNQLMAASVVVSLPVLIGFILVQRHLVAGLSAGAVK